MALSASDLKQAILDEVSALSTDDKKSALSVHSAWANAVRTYITENLEVQGVYVGVTPVSAPDPLSGSYVWGVTTFVLTGAQIFAGVQGQTDPALGFNAWRLAIESAIKTIVMMGPCSQSLITTAPGLVLAPFFFNISQGDLSGVQGVEEAIEVVATKLVDSLKATVVQGLTSAAVSTTPGSGTVTYVKLQ